MTLGDLIQWIISLAAVLGSFGVVVWLLFALLNAGSQKCEYSVVSQPIYSLEREGIVSGSFVLGFGSVNEHPTYYFYTDDTQGVILGSRDAFSTALIETDEVEPSLVFYDVERGNCNDSIMDYRGGFGRKIMYIPEGTIKREFKVN